MSIVSDIRIQVDEAAGSTFFTAEHIYDAANEAVLEVYSRAKPNLTSVNWPVNTGDDLVFLPPGIMVPQQIIINNLEYWPTTQAKLEQFSRSWRGEALALPKWFVLWDALRMRLFPRPDQAYDFTMWGVPWPEEINASNLDIASMDAQLKLATGLKAAGNLLEFSAPNVADTMIAESEQILSAYTKRLRNQQGHNIRRVRPGTLFTASQNGVIRLGKRLS